MKDIRSVLEEYKIEVKAEGSVWRAFCPFHSDKNKPNFTVYTNTNSWFCFSCNMGGDVAYFVAKMERIPYSEAKKRMGDEITTSFLSELVEGLNTEVEPLNLNMETAFFLSPKVRDLLYTTTNTSAIFDFMRELDGALTQVITPQRQAQLYKKFMELKKNIV